MAKREMWIDIAKGIGILLVIMGHSSAQVMYMEESNLPTYLYDAIYSFHMPLFFFLSGLVYKKKGSFSTVLKNKAKRLLVPLLMFSGPFIIMQIVHNVEAGDSVFNAWLGQIEYILFGQGHYWYIYFLFLISVFAYFVDANPKYKWGGGILSGIYSVLLIPNSLDPYILRLPFYFFYFLLGWLIGCEGYKRILKKHTVQKLIISIMLFGFLKILDKNINVNYVTGINNILLGVIGTNVICTVSYLIESRKIVGRVLATLGGITLPIYLMDKYYNAAFSEVLTIQKWTSEPILIMLFCFILETTMLSLISQLIFKKFKLCRIIGGC